MHPVQSLQTQLRNRLLVIGAALAITAVAATLPVGGSADEKESKAAVEKNSADSSTDAEKKALAEFNALVGGWRGVGQPRRGSRKGAWSEKADWVWDFKDGPAIKYEVDGGKLVDSAVLTWDAAEGAYVLDVKLADEQNRRYKGKLNDDKLTLTSATDDDGYTHRVTITLLNEKRTLVLLEQRKEPQKFYSRVAEVGYTRKGTRLATAGSGEPECVVTGGAGTMPVMHQGKTYYVCCSGCRQAFEDDPEGILEDYRKRLAERAKEKP